jgi:hypothetical protein
MPKIQPPKLPLGFQFKSLLNNAVIVNTEDPHKLGRKAKKAQLAVDDIDVIVLDDAIAQPVDQPETKQLVVAPPKAWKSTYDVNRKVQEDWLSDARLTSFRPIESTRVNDFGKRVSCTRQECIPCTMVTGHSVTVKNKVHNMIKHVGITTGPPTLQGVHFVYMMLIITI